MARELTCVTPPAESPALLAATPSLPPPTSLAGFRFHPTDEEIVGYYLWRKACGKPLVFEVVSEVNVYNSEPWDLPAYSLVNDGNLEWYFFSPVDRKYRSRLYRATEKGYWRTTGKDRPVRHESKMMGMKKTLVFHRGPAPDGTRTDWVMREYRLLDQELGQAGVVQDAFVLCKLFKRRGHAPLIEEESHDDATLLVPGGEATDDMTTADECLTALKGKCKTTPIPLSQEDIESQFGKTMIEAAKNLNVSLSTLKRKCKVLGISEWRGKDYLKRNVKHSYKNQNDTNEDKGGTIQDPSANNGEMCLDENTLTIKAEYADDMIKFDLQISSATFVAIEKEISEGFKLNPNDYKLKYLDEDGDWILLSCDKDIKVCIKNQRNLNVTRIKMRVLPRQV